MTGQGGTWRPAGLAMLAVGAALAFAAVPAGAEDQSPPAPVLSSSVPPPSADPGRSNDLVFDTAILQTLDKVTGRVGTLDAPVGVTVHFGTLEIIARTCRKRPPEDPPETAAFLDIWEIRPGEAATSLFRGWMFASSPALSALEHPVYDLWVVDCADSAARTAPPSKDSEPKSP